MHLHILLLLFLRFLLTHSQCPATNNGLTLVQATQQAIGNKYQPSMGHLLTIPGPLSLPFTYNVTAVYYLFNMVLADATVCPVQCLTTLNGYYKDNSGDLSISMLRPQDATAYSGYTALTTKQAPTIYCASTSGYCGATIPIYLYYSSTYDDYYASTGPGPDVNASTYSVTNMGLPLCYIWNPPNVTTTTTTTVLPITVPSNSSVNGTTTTTVNPLNNSTNVTDPLANTTLTTVLASNVTTLPNNLTTTSVPFNMTTSTLWSNTTTTTPLVINGTTATPSNSSTTTLLPGVNSTITTVLPSNVTTTTVSTGNLTTTVPITGNMTTTVAPDSNSTTTEADSKKSSFNWRWIPIVIGVLVGCAILVGALAFLTYSFISPVKSPSIYPMKESMQLPPQPVCASPAANPFTVAPPAMHGPPPMYM